MYSARTGQPGGVCVVQKKLLFGSLDLPSSNNVNEVTVSSGHRSLELQASPGKEDLILDYLTGNVV